VDTELRPIIAIIIVVLMASPSAFARKRSIITPKPAAAIKQQSATKTDPGGVARHPW